jgi:hypothetical protein
MMMAIWAGSRAGSMDVASAHSSVPGVNASNKACMRKLSSYNAAVRVAQTLIATARAFLLISYS